ncbi:MAG: sigma-70 family RNA polymerase sigma factor [Nocardioides sp.]
MAHPRSARETPVSRTQRVAETTSLLSRRASGDDADAVEEQVIRLNMVVARDVARRYHGRGLAADDLDQVAYLGLCKAVRNYDPDKATDFHSYAVPTIRGELRRWFRDAGWMVRPPRSVQELQSKVTAVQDQLALTLGRPARPEEVAHVLQVEPAAVHDAMSANGCFTPTSLDAPYEGGTDIGTHLGDRLGEADPAFARAEARVTLAPVLADLSRRERRMLELRYLHGATQAEIGAEIGVTQMQVSRLLSALLERLRERLTGRDNVAAA